MRLRCRIPVASAILSVLFCSTANSADDNDDWTRVPTGDWTRAAPEAVGYSTPRLAALRTWLKTQQTTAMMITVRG